MEGHEDSAHIFEGTPEKNKRNDLHSIHPLNGNLENCPFVDILTSEERERTQFSATMRLPCCLLLVLAGGTGALMHTGTWRASPALFAASAGPPSRRRMHPRTARIGTTTRVGLRQIAIPNEVVRSDFALFAKYRKPAPSPSPSPSPSPPDPDLDDATAQAERALAESEVALAAADRDIQIRTPPGPIGVPLPPTPPRTAAPTTTKSKTRDAARRSRMIRRDAIASAVGGAAVGAAAGVAVDVQLLQDLSLDFDLDDCAIPPAVLGVAVGAAAFGAASEEEGALGGIVRAAIGGPTRAAGNAIAARVGRGVNETVENTRAIPGRVARAIESRVEETVDGVRRTPGRIGTAVADASARTVEKIANAPGAVAEGTKSAVRSAVKSGVNKAKEIPGEIGRAIGTRVEETVEEVKGGSVETCERIKETLREQVEEVKDSSLETLERIKDTLREQASERRRQRQARAVEEMEKEAAEAPYGVVSFPGQNIGDVRESGVTTDWEGAGGGAPVKNRVLPTPPLEEQWAAAREREAQERSKRLDERQRRIEQAFAGERKRSYEIEVEEAKPTAREQQKNEAEEWKGAFAEQRQAKMGRAEERKKTLTGQSGERNRQAETPGGAAAQREEIERYSAIANVAAERKRRADAARATALERAAKWKRSLAEQAAERKRRADAERSLARKRAEEMKGARRAEREADLRRKADAAARAAARERQAEEKRRVLAKEDAKRRRLADTKARAAKSLAQKEAEPRAEAVAAREAAERKRRIDAAKAADRKQAVEREKVSARQRNKKQVDKKRDGAVSKWSSQAGATVSLSNLFQAPGDRGRTSSPAAPKLASQQRRMKRAPKGVPTISNWRKNRDGSIAGFISGSPKYSDGQAITTSRIKGSIVGGTVVETFSGSRYYLLEPSTTTSVDPVVTITKPGATISLSRFFRLSGDEATAIEVPKQPLKRPGKKIAPKGIPIISRWRKGDDGCIAGFISGSPSYRDGETIATSRIKGTPVGGTVIETVSGSRYFLEPNTAERGSRSAKEWATEAKAGARSSLSRLFQLPSDDGRAPATAEQTRTQTDNESMLNVVPTISHWRQNRDGSIAGIISGSPAFSDGDTITTSRIKGKAPSGKVVETFSGSR